MTIRSDIAMPGTLIDYRAREHAAGRPSAAIASRLMDLQSAWMRWLARHRLARSIAHLDNRLLADIGLGPHDLGFAERLSRRRTFRDDMRTRTPR